MDFASASPAGLAKAVMLFVWVEESVWIMEFAPAILFKAGEVMYVKFLDVLVSAKTALVMATATAPHMSAHVTLGGQV